MPRPDKMPTMKPENKKEEEPKEKKKTILESLVEDIKRDPKNLAAWAVFGDYLLEQGDPRGEIIVLALAYESTENDENAQKINSRKEDLRSETINKFIDDYPSVMVLNEASPVTQESEYYTHEDNRDVTIGFPQDIRFNGGVEELEKLTSGKYGYFLRKMQLLDAENYREIIRSDAIKSFSELQIDGGVNDDDLSYLPKKLQALSIIGDSITAAGIKEIAKMKRLKKFYLDLYYPDTINWEAVRELSKNNNIEELSLDGCGIDDEGAKFLSTMENLKILRLPGNNLGIEGVEAISGLKNLMHLSISNNNLGRDALNIISKMENLEVLELINSGAGDEDMIIFSKMKNLKELYLGYDNRITNESDEIIEEMRQRGVKVEIEIIGVGDEEDD